MNPDMVGDGRHAVLHMQTGKTIRVFLEKHHMRSLHDGRAFELLEGNQCKPTIVRLSNIEFIEFDMRGDAGYEEQG